MPYVLIVSNVSPNRDPKMAKMALYHLQISKISGPPPKSLMCMDAPPPDHAGFILEVRKSTNFCTSKYYFLSLKHLLI